VDSWALAVVAGLVLVLASLSRWIEKSVLTGAIVFLSAGILFGGEGLGWIDLSNENGFVRLLAETTLALVLFLDASRIDLRVLRRELGVPVRLLGIGLPLTVLLGTAAALGLIDGITVGEALVLAVVLAPTDAALGLDVVTDRRLPSRIRQSLNIESGLNDGLCVPLLFIAVAIAEAEEGALSGGNAARIVAEEIGYGTIAGVAAGALGAFALGYARRHRLVTHEWAQVIPVASATLAFGVAAPIGGSGFIAAFVGGIVYGVVRTDTRAEERHFLDVTGQSLTAVTFVVFGAVVLGPALDGFGWQSLAYAALSLTIVRMLPVALSLIGTGFRPQSTAFVAWFGPRGLASLVFVVIVIQEADVDHLDVLVATMVTTIALSVYAHGFTSRPLTTAYARWFVAHPRPPAGESVPTHEHSWRRPAEVTSVDDRRSGQGPA
jgi:NhaP-type Na+/H+ or K+/H+ antiporter